METAYPTFNLLPSTAVNQSFQLHLNRNLNILSQFNDGALTQEIIRVGLSLSA